MPRALLELTNEEVQALPLDQLALVVLRHLRDSREWNSHNFIQNGHNNGVPGHILGCWAEALNWLISRNLVSRDSPNQSADRAIFITRLGNRVLDEGIELTLAASRLGVSLHERLAGARSQFLIGEYELAAFAALREVEIRVREVSGESTSLLGVRLMRKVFGENGIFAESDMDAGERVGIMELFAGAIGTFKNPPSHRQVDYANPTEASEVVLFADLLMRLLDRYESEG